MRLRSRSTYLETLELLLEVLDEAKAVVDLGEHRATLGRLAGSGEEQW